MQTLADQAKELAQKDRALADSARAAPGARGDARQSARLAEQSKRLREQMDDLKDRLAKDKAEAGASRTEQAGEHAGLLGRGGGPLLLTGSAGSAVAGNLLTRGAVALRRLRGSLLLTVLAVGTLLALRRLPLRRGWRAPWCGPTWSRSSGCLHTLCGPSWEIDAEGNQSVPR